MHQGHVPARLMAMRIASDDDDNDDTNTGPLRKGEMNTVFTCVTVFRRCVALSFFVPRLAIVHSGARWRPPTLLHLGLDARTFGLIYACGVA